MQTQKKEDEGGKKVRCGECEQFEKAMGLTEEQKMAWKKCSRHREVIMN